MENSIRSYRDLVVWQKSMDLVVAVYVLTDQYPKSELYGLTSQTRRSAVSIPSNIAEGKYRHTRKDYHNFLIKAYASGAELETQIEIAKRLSWGRRLDSLTVDRLLDEVMRMLNKMTSELEVPNDLT